MSTKQGRTIIRETFRARYDVYAKKAVENWTIQCAVDAWKKDNKTEEPLFTKQMWQVISGATYTEPVVVSSYHEEMDKARRTRIKRRVGSMLYSEEIAELAFRLMRQNRNHTTERAVTLARVEVYDRHHGPGEKKT